ncbi:MRG/MORF4L-binding protein [Toxorhynchites rutilus septentrionalis]|uniref:MRG/MORF4L-binding protein n=1 Tax=Toxorhynchites rutilus septentrionalis TaxID=329112 RepID=UPI00247A6EE6|nr:MRG/MORF4L-binding protein [Toxorhynchites rutilus septentrionalis]
MTTVKEKMDSEYFEWVPEDEIQLFFAMEDLKPVGINKHFFIACIVERLSKALNREISSDSVWSHLRTMYNLKALDEQEQLPFPNEEIDFDLPEAEFPSILKRKSVEEQSADEGRKSESKTESAAKTVKDRDHTEKDKQSDRDSKDSKFPKSKMDAGDNNTPKRAQKRTRGSMSLEPNAGSPASTPPNVQSTKRRRI